MGNYCFAGWLRGPITPSNDLRDVVNDLHDVTVVHHKPSSLHATNPASALNKDRNNCSGVFQDLPVESNEDQSVMDVFGPALSDVSSYSVPQSEGGTVPSSIGRSLEVLPSPSRSPGSSRKKSRGECCECPVCHKTLRDKYKLKTHIADMHSAAQHIFRCPVCNKVYKTKNTLSNHISLSHRGYHSRYSPNRTYMQQQNEQQNQFQHYQPDTQRQQQYD